MVDGSEDEPRRSSICGCMTCAWARPETGTSGERRRNRGGRGPGGAAWSHSEGTQGSAHRETDARTDTLNRAGRRVARLLAVINGIVIKQLKTATGANLQARVVGRTARSGVPRRTGPRVGLQHDSAGLGVDRGSPDSGRRGGVRHRGHRRIRSTRCLGVNRVCRVAGRGVRHEGILHGLRGLRHRSSSVIHLLPFGPGRRVDALRDRARGSGVPQQFC
jgi:hypothetical protein